ncbi:MAG: hypothetical protein C0604_08040, partial [Clostridiales bacterium]
AIRIGLINGEFIINPTFEQVEESSLDMIVAATEEAVAEENSVAKEDAVEEIAGEETAE